MLSFDSQNFDGANLSPQNNLPRNENATDGAVVQAEGSCRCFSLDELLIATQNFHDALVVGNGGFGKVYKGLIDNGKTVVAIKRLNAESSAEEFWTEIKTLSKLRHVHLVTLIGYCNEGQEMALVYEYVARGTLDDHLYKFSSTKSNTSISPLSWEQRLNICIGAARGLDHLHSGTDQSFIHRDVKTTNILLDKNWTVKISGFGLSKSTTSHSITHITTNVKGTFGYLDPDYFITQRLTKKSDVYAFGMVLLQMLCGRLVVDRELDEEQISLVHWAQQCIKKGNLDRLINPSLNGQIVPRSLKYFVILANNCLCTAPKSRPTMAEVVDSLVLALVSQHRVETGGVITKMFQSVDQWFKDRKEINSSSGHGQLNDSNSSSGHRQLNDSPRKSDSNGVAQLYHHFSPVEIRVDTKSELPFLKSTENEIEGGDIQVEKSCRCFSLDEVLTATNNFDDAFIIGIGGFGEVYKGFINNGNTIVAIKRLNVESKQGAGEFWTEITTLSKLQHVHLVTLMGYCNEGIEMVLVYEYIAHGTLADHLYKLSSTKSNTSISPLSWEQRLNICIGAARGLDHLHGGTNQSFIHRDVKTSNILLDENWTAKISDLGLSKSTTSHSITHISTRVKGSFGYFDPDYFITQRLTTKSDVYAFGVVLLEVLCGRPPADRKLDDEQIILVRWAQKYIKKGKVDRIIDPSLSGQIEPSCLKSFVRLANNCLHTVPKLRPTMAEVVDSLVLALVSQQRVETVGIITKAFQSVDRWFKDKKR